MVLEIPSWGVALGISAANGIIVYVAAVAGQKTDLRNLRDWVDRLDKRVGRLERESR